MILFIIFFIDVQNCRGQAYDNALVMSGRLSGVQTRIKEINPKADFANCTNHSLNLAGSYAASVAVNSITFFGTVERVYVFFSSSTHRWDVLKSVVKRNVKRIVETRWSARCDAVKALKESFSEILDVLEDLTADNENANTRTDAALLLSSLQSFPFISFLNFWSHVLPEIDDTQKYLQNKGLDLHRCDLKVGALKNLLISQREEFVNKSIEAAIEQCNDLGISTEKRMRRKKRMPGENAADAGLTFKEELRREMLESIDRCISEIATRFEKIHALALKYMFLKPSNLLNEEYECEVNGFIGDIALDGFELERRRLKSFVDTVEIEDSITGEESEPLDLLRFILRYDLEACVPNIVILLRICLTVAVSVASCERSFSKLKLIKTYLRSTMSEVRLTNLAILSIERDAAEKLDFEEVMTEFANLKARKTNL